MKKVILFSLASIPLICSLFSCSSVITERKISSSENFEVYDKKFAENLFFEVKKEIESLDLTSACEHRDAKTYAFGMSNSTVKSDFENFYKAINNFSEDIIKLKELGIEFEVVFADNLKKCSLSPWAMNFNSSTVWVLNRIHDSIIDQIQEGRIPNGNKIRIVLTDKGPDEVTKINEARSAASYFKYDNDKVGINVFVTTRNPFIGQTWVTNAATSWAGLYGLILSEKKGEPKLRPSVVPSPDFTNKIGK